MTPENSIEKWDQLQLSRGANFLQSAAWAQFQATASHSFHMLAGEGWSCLLLKKSTHLGNYWFAPYGPTLASPSDLSPAIEAIRAEALNHKIDWLRLEPIVKNNNISELRIVLKNCGGQPAPRDVEPPMTRVVDLSPSAEELLISLSPKTRTRIRRNQREATIDFKTSTEPADIQLFTAMLDSVARRSGANFFPKNYFEKQAECLMPAGFMYLELAYCDGQPLGAAVIHDYGEFAYYTYAASLPEARNKDVSELLLWHAMLNAKNRGRHYFDLFGIAPADASPSHPWYGFSSFKEKFGGQVVEYVGTWDVPISSKYRLYRLARGLKSKVRG